MSAAKRLKEVRNIFHLNQMDFAKRIGVTGSLVSQMEQGKTGVSWKTAHSIEEILGISAEWLMTGKGEIASDSRGNAGALMKVPSPEQFPAVAEMLKLFTDRMTLADWEALNGICERVLGKQTPVLDLSGQKRRGA